MALENLAAAKRAAADPMPERLGEYRLVREVGRGGMGVVYEAVQENLGRHVALKVLPFSGAADAHRLERFRREARAAANLHHTHIVPVFGVGEQDGVHYYAMQFIQGQGLDSVLHELRRLRGPPEADAAPPSRQRPDLSAGIAASLVKGSFAGSVAARPAGGDGSTNRGPGDATPTRGSSSDLGAQVAQSDGSYFRGVARLAAQAAEALAYAHAQGVLHRDIKPSNLLLDTQGTLWVTDFGLAKVEGTDELTSPGDVVGTLRYMAPERFRGQADARGDLYSLGLTLYELATRRPAFAAVERAQLLDRVQHEEPARPRRLDPGLPRDLETIILKATAKEPAGRYQTAAELAEDLRLFLGDQPIRARRTPWHERTWRWCRRNPALARLTAALATLLLLVAVGATIAAYWFSALAQSEHEAREQADEAKQRAEDSAERLTRSYRLLESGQDRPLRWAFHGVALGNLGQLDPAEASLTQAINRQPHNASLWLARGYFQAENGRWDKAARDCDHALSLQPKEASSWDECRTALLRLRVGDVAGYRQGCGRLLERFGEPKETPEDPGRPARVAWVCLLAPGAVEDVQAGPAGRVGAGPGRQRCLARARGGDGRLPVGPLPAGRPTP